MGNLSEIFGGRKFAGPETQKAYTVALGEFLVEFNQIENVVRDAIKTILDGQGRGHLWKSLKRDYISKQVVTLELISLGVPGFPDIPYKTIQQLNATRNILAHGHFEQDLFSEEFQVIGKDGADTITVEQIKAATDQAASVSWEMRNDLYQRFFPEWRGDMD